MRFALIAFGLVISGTAAASQLERVGGPSVPGTPQAVIVHGIDPVLEELEPLAENFVARGFQTHLFHYSSVARLNESADQLNNELHGLVNQRVPERIVVVGYSLGGLVARRALTANRSAPLEDRPVSFELITIASPLGGFRSANLWWLGLGFTRPAFRDLGTESSFIEEPGELGRNVRHTKIETDETGARRLENGRWSDDDVVGIRSQTHSYVDEQAERIYRVAIGHTQVVNVNGKVHQALTDIFDTLFEETSFAPLVTSSESRSERAGATFN
jgi:hypothetical protein